MFNYSFIHKPNFEIDEKIVGEIFLTIDSIINQEQTGTLNIVFVNNEQIQELNKNYREIDKVTDVLSFHYYENFSNFDKYDIVGEILLSEQKIVSQGIEYGLGTEKEFYKLLIHSILHILGYDHEIDEDYLEMSKLEKKIWEKVLINN